LTLNDAIALVNKKADLKITENIIGQCYGLSLMTVQDPIKESYRLN
jgi:hypothetical protein